MRRGKEQEQRAPASCADETSTMSVNSGRKLLTPGPHLWASLASDGVQPSAFSGLPPCYYPRKCTQKQKYWTLAFHGFSSSLTLQSHECLALDRIRIALSVWTTKHCVYPVYPANDNPCSPEVSFSSVCQRGVLNSPAKNFASRLVSQEGLPLSQSFRSLIGYFLILFIAKGMASSWVTAKSSSLSRRPATSTTRASSKNVSLFP
jgi:hypothetical protein